MGFTDTTGFHSWWFWDLAVKTRGSLKRHGSVVFMDGPWMDGWVPPRFCEWILKGGGIAETARTARRGRRGRAFGERIGGSVRVSVGFRGRGLKTEHGGGCFSFFF